ncbi:MAG: hypothetical protein NTV09_09520 [Bacteroidetes bacterium]|nr:hypothetical protein [Bacteroidota bacterium]
MKKTLLISLALFFIVSAQAQFSYYSAFSLGNNANDRGTSIASDAAGNYYCTGMHTYWMDLNPLGTPYYVYNNGTYTTDIYVAKYSQQGILQWGFNIGGSGDELVTKINLDATGNIYITGNFQDTVDFDPGSGDASRISRGGTDLFLAKYDVNGNFQWVNAIGDSLDERSYDVIINPDGDHAVITGGYQSVTMDMDPGNGTQLIVNNGNASLNTGNCFVASYATLNGAYDWSFNIGGFGGATGYRIENANASSIFVAGIVSGDSTDFDPGAGTSNVYSPGNGRIFLAKYSNDNSSTAFQWVKSFGGIYGETINGLDVDDSGNPYLGGYFNSDSMDIDPDTGTYFLHNYPNGVQDIYVAKFDTGGVLNWAFAVGGYYSEVAQDLVVDHTGHLFITGNYGDTVDFDPGPNVFNLTGQLGSDAYLAEYDQDGHFIDAIPFRGNGN